MIIVTGGSGQAGKACVRDLVEHGYDVTSVDLAPFRADDGGIVCDARFPSFQDDAAKRKWNLWGYIDARDAAQAFRLTLESSLKGAAIFVIANADTVMNRPNEELLSEHYASVPRKRAFSPNETLLSIEKARNVLGYEPRYGWQTSNK